MHGDQEFSMIIFFLKEDKFHFYHPRNCGLCVIVSLRALNYIIISYINDVYKSLIFKLVGHLI